MLRLFWKFKGTIMKSSKLFAIAALAALASVGAHADDAVAPEYTQAFKGSRARAEVQAEAVQAAANKSYEPAGSRVAAPVKSALDRATVRAETAQAVRQGKIPHGEV